MQTDTDSQSEEESKKNKENGQTFKKVEIIYDESTQKNEIQKSPKSINVFKENNNLPSENG